MIVTDDEALAERARLLRQHGLTRSTWERHRSGPGEYDVVEAGWNFRPTELQSALGATHLRKLAANQERRRALVERYEARLGEIEGLTVPFAPVAEWHRPAHHLFSILAPDAASRQRLREALHAAGVQTSHHYTPVHRFTFYRERAGDAQPMLPKTEDYAERQITLPLHPLMDFDQVDLIVETIRRGPAR